MIFIPDWVMFCSIGSIIILIFTNLFTYIKFKTKIEQLNIKCEYLNKLLLDVEESKEKNINLVKGALFELGGDLSKRLIEIHRSETKQARELSEKTIEVTNQKFHSEFERLIGLMGSLTKEIDASKNSVDLIKQSLLSPSACGKLAEVTLENLLKTSGLRSELDFFTQYSFTNLSNSIYRPDAVVFLPADHIMIIDAKASKFLMDVDNSNGVSLSKSMNSHLKALNDKEYVENITSNFRKKGKNFTKVSMLMFLPTEHAIDKLCESDSEFMDKAHKNNIYPVGPSGLKNLLYLAKLQITEQLRLENHQLILHEVEAIIKSITNLADYSSKFGTSLQSLVNNYDRFAASFNKNFLTKSQNIQKLGVAGQSKNIFTKLTRYELTSTTALNIVDEKDNPD